MDVKIKLPGKMPDCPQWWQNFVNETFDSVRHRYLDRHGRRKILCEILTVYSATLVSEDDEYIVTDVVFKSDLDFLVFKLRWM